MTEDVKMPRRTRFYRAELRGTAAWEHDLEQVSALGRSQSSATLGQSPSALGQSQTALGAGVQSLPSLSQSKSFASGLLKPEGSSMSGSKAWGSANFVRAPDGTPILPSATSVRPKAKVTAILAPCL